MRLYFSKMRIFLACSVITSFSFISAYAQTNSISEDAFNRVLRIIEQERVHPDSSITKSKNKLDDDIKLVKDLHAEAQESLDNFECTRQQKTLHNFEALYTVILDSLKEKAPLVCFQETAAGSSFERCLTRDQAYSELKLLDEDIIGLTNKTCNIEEKSYD